MADLVRWGVLGAANFARNTMAPAIHEARRGSLAALATRDRAKAAPFEAFAPGLRVHDSYESLLADPGVDAVYIPLPNAMHVEWSLKAADAGKAVLCEKPMAMREAEFDRLVAARDRTGRLLAEAYMPVHHPQWQKARALLAEGAIGRLHTATSVFSFGLADPANIRNRADVGGGAMRDIGVYPIGTFRFVTGLEPKVTGVDFVFENGVDTSAWITARAGEARFNFHLSIRTTKRQEMVFEGTEGWMRLPAPYNAGQYGEAGIYLRREGEEERYFRFPDVRQYVLQVEAFNAALLDGAAYPCPLEFSRGTQAVIDAAFAMA